MNILILGATGLLGNTLFRFLSQSDNLQIFGTTRIPNSKEYFTQPLADRLLAVNNLEHTKEIAQLLDQVRPDVVINCISYRRSSKQDLMHLLSMLSVFPRRLKDICGNRGIRVIHFSSDGVYSGAHGMCTENEIPDAEDYYGIAKYLGELDGFNVLTIRTSMLGHELASKNGLLDWFLSQTDACNCYTKAIFSGLPAVEIARIVRDFILTNESLNGIYHLAAEPISKFELLALVRQQYGKKIKMIPDDSVVIDRSLSAERFRLVTGYTPPSWQEMIATMHSFNFGLRKS